MNQFIKLFIRNIRNNPKLFLINVTSFSIGIVTVLFITLFVVKEFRADRFHPKHKDIYRVLSLVWDSPQKSASTEFPLGGLLKDNHPEIEDFSRYRELTRYQVTVDNKEFTDQKISWVDASFFNMFNFKLKLGDVNSIFDNPNTIIIDQKTAKLYFNTIDVIGKTISAIYPGEEERKNYTIVGVLDKYPEESTLQPKLITDNKSLAVKYNDDYSSSVTQLYLYVPNCPSPRDLAQALSITYRKKRNDFYGRNDPINKDLYTLQPLTDLYLHSTDVTDGLPKGDYLLVWVLTGIGVILLVVTFMNYLILTLGASLKNQKQNQIRTILGSSTSWLKMKYASESVFYSLITFVAALFLFPVVHRIISSFTEIRYSIYSSSDPKIIVLFLLALILIGASIGYLQYNLLFHPKYKNTQLAGFKTRKPFFNYLIQFQLFIFIVIIASIILINRQMQFIKNQDIGYDLKNTIPITINDELNMELFMKECSKYSFIKHASVGHNMFCNTPYLNEITIEKNNEIVKSQYIWGDNNYIDTYNIKLLYGENIEGDKLPSVTQWWKYPESYDVMDILVNEEFVRKARLENPIGTIVTINNNGTGKGQICGVIADVKNSTFYHAVTPMVIGYGISYMPSIIVSVQEGHLEEFKTMINNFFIKIGKKDHIGYQTWNFDYEVWYHKEQVLIRLLSVLSFVLLVILLLGIYGTSMFISENKTKEIGIRKVNGAKISEVLVMLNKDFIKWVVVAFIIATPIAYYAMQKWLENFAYKTDLSWWIFALAGLLALGVALLTVSWQSWRAATRNPVEALRYE